MMDKRERKSVLRTEAVACYEATFSRIQARYDKELSELGARIREELVVPLCREYKLYYLAGNGTFYFGKKSKRRSPGEDYYSNVEDLRDAPDLSESAKTALGPVLELLNRESTHGCYIGYLVAPVDFD